MDEQPSRNRTRRLTGWLLAVGSPGVAAGLAETALAAIQTAAGYVSIHPTVTLTVFGFWGLSAVASAVGGWLIASDAARRFVRFMAAGLSVAAGSFAYLVAFAALDLLRNR